jgi:hypothetical protein
MPIIPKEDIPNQLWKNEHLYMPGLLVTSYDTMLRQYNIGHLALETTDSGRVVGGPTLEETLEHYGRRLSFETALSLSHS